MRKILHSRNINYLITYFNINTHSHLTNVRYDFPTELSRGIAMDNELDTSHWSREVQKSCKWILLSLEDIARKIMEVRKIKNATYWNWTIIFNHTLHLNLQIVKTRKRFLIVKHNDFLFKAVSVYTHMIAVIIDTT